MQPEEAEEVSRRGAEEVSRRGAEEVSRHNESNALAFPARQGCNYT